MSNRIKVEIYGQSYTMAGDLDEGYVQGLARYVDEKMSAVAAATQTVDSVRVAVLAASCTRSGRKRAIGTKTCANTPSSASPSWNAR
jgi:hypothetical protein